MGKPVENNSVSPSRAQLEVLEVVWARGEAGVAEIWEELCKRRSVARNTVQTTVARLEARGLLRYRQVGNAFVYSATKPRTRVLRGLVARLIDTAFGGSASSLVLSLLEDETLSKDEADRIRALIEEKAAESRPARPGRRGRKG